MIHKIFMSSLKISKCTHTQCTHTHIYIYIVRPSRGMMTITKHTSVYGYTVQSWHQTASRNQDTGSQCYAGSQVLLLHIFSLPVSLWPISSMCNYVFDVRCAKQLCKQCNTICDQNSREASSKINVVV